MEWRDTNGTQNEPAQISNAEIKVTALRTVSKVWFASPDINGGVAQNLQFTQVGNEVKLILPSLKYWDMVVLEY